MHLYANSMNILERIQQRLPVEQSETAQRAAAVRKTLVRTAFELHRLRGNGSMSPDSGQAGQWDGDARRQPRREPRHLGTPMRAKDESVPDETVSFWA